MMQSIVRRKQAKRKVNTVRQEKKAQNESALMLQQRARSKLARKRVASKRQEKRESLALIKIQTKARSGLAAKEAKRRRKKKKQNAALLVLQCWFRVLLAHKRVASRIRQLLFLLGWIVSALPSTCSKITPHRLVRIETSSFRWGTTGRSRSTKHIGSVFLGVQPS